MPWSPQGRGPKVSVVLSQLFAQLSEHFELPRTSVSSSPALPPSSAATTKTARARVQWDNCCMVSGSRGPAAAGMVNFKVAMYRYPQILDSLDPAPPGAPPRPSSGRTGQGPTSFCPHYGPHASDQGRVKVVRGLHVPGGPQNSEQSCGGGCVLEPNPTCLSVKAALLGQEAKGWHGGTGPGARAAK